MAIGVICWRCEQPGHAAAECQRPPAENRKDLSDRIDRYKMRWFDGDIKTAQKQAWIAAEMRAFNGKVKAK